MVGYACSADEVRGYNYIIIKSYDCDDWSFVSDYTPFQTFRVCRRDLSVELLHPEDASAARHLQYRNITDICEMLFRAEYSRDYPVVLYWSLTPSGVCEAKKQEDYVNLWPLCPRHNCADVGYINITDIIFEPNSTILEVSFVSQVINEVAVFAGIHTGEVVTVIGDKLYCSFALSRVIKKLFSDGTLLKLCLKFCRGKDIPGKKIKSRTILKTAKKFGVPATNEHEFASKELCSIKTGCICDILHALVASLKNHSTAKDFIEKIKSAFDKAFLKLDLQKENFVFYSGGRSASDMNYLTFNNLMMTFTFGNFKDEMTDIIKTNRARKHSLKSIEIPNAIYNGKLYFDY